ncbi:DegV family protein [Lactobacillus sp. DCY120]|uniref:DegV family protein n=1 Tax=Bombilactobacillus apium TaxID=2675299 RepID=A0A850R8P0_9LACO|nr:DegV family protein [Bombilactobacillus apium]NVY95766.1 DegV family protein [Bombilactobacillus apium]
MTTVKIVTDSSIQLTAAQMQAYSIHEIPLNVEVGGQQYVDGETITRSEFVQKMAESDQLPKSSQPAIGRFVEVFDELGQDGSEVLAITMTKGLSGTVTSAQQAAQLSSTKVTVIDSDFTDSGLSFQVLKAAEMAQAGASIAEILPELTKIRETTKVYVAMPTLENIVKGGRLGKLAASLTTFLKISIVVELRDGKLRIAKKGRGIKTIQNFAQAKVQELIEHGDRLGGVSFSYVNDDYLPQKFTQQIKERWPQVPIVTEVTSPVISTHAGLGAFAIIYYYK